jgi:hypothetical protein
MATKRNLTDEDIMELAFELDCDDSLEDKDISVQSDSDADDDTDDITDNHHTVDRQYKLPTYCT